jgi:hypothetical protein
MINETSSCNWLSNWIHLLTSSLVRLERELTHPLSLLQSFTLVSPLKGFSHRPVEVGKARTVFALKPSLNGIDRKSCRITGSANTDKAACKNNLSKLGRKIYDLSDGLRSTAYVCT